MQLQRINLPKPLFYNQEEPHRKYVIDSNIIQTWKTHDIKPEWLPSIKSINKHLPKHRHIFTTDIDNLKFLEHYFPDFVPYYKAFPHDIMRADAIRAALLYVHGGIYMDMDIELQGDVSKYFTQSDCGLYFVLGSINNTKYNNFFMVSAKHHPFWLDVIEEMKKPLPWYAIGKHLEVLCGTGAIMLDRVIRHNKYRYATLPTQDFAPCSLCDEDIDVCSATAPIRPLEGKTWNGLDTQVYNFMFCNWSKVLLVLILLVVLILLLYKTW